MRGLMRSTPTMKAPSTKRNCVGWFRAKELAKADKDNDATLDKAEYEAIAADRFQAADTDHDGTLDKKELASKAGKALMRMMQ